MWLSVGLTATYILVMALVDYPPPDWPKVEWWLLSEELFWGPMIVAGFLSILMRRVEARRVTVGFQVGYILMTLTTFHSTFTGEHDAQYQLALLFIPLIGYPGVVGAGLIAACLR